MSFVTLSVTCNMSPVVREARLPTSATVGELKGRCEMLTGVLMSAMQLQLKSDNGEILAELGDDSKRFEEYSPVDGCQLHVIDKTGGAASISDEGDVQKFEISEEAYEQRSDSVRAFKQRHGLGRFDAEARAEKDRREQDFLKEANEKAAALKVGQRCEVRVTDHPVRRGTIAFLGDTQFKPGPWVGIRYDEPLGKNNGTVNGVNYFECENKYGGFCRPQDVTVGDFPEEIDVDADEF